MIWGALMCGGLGANTCRLF